MIFLEIVKPVEPILNPEVAYVALAASSWVWALSQLLWFTRKPTAWRFSTFVLMVNLAVFFTFVGSVFWFNWFDHRIHSAVVWTVAIINSLVFLHWLLLPHNTPERDAPLKDG